MKKPIMLLIMLMGVAILSACNSGNSSEESTKTFVQDMAGIEGLYNETTIAYEGDTIISLKTKNEMAYSVLEISDKAEAEELFGEVEDELSTDLKGVSIDTQFTDEKMVLETTVIMKELDAKEIEENPELLMSEPVLFDEEGNFNPDVSFQEAVEMLEEFGFSEK